MAAPRLQSGRHRGRDPKTGRDLGVRRRRLFAAYRSRRGSDERATPYLARDGDGYVTAMLLGALQEADPALRERIAVVQS
jgi:hypothetical protein